MFKSFNQFTKDIFENKISDGMRKMYGSEAKHRVSYLNNVGFEQWIESFRGEELSLPQMKSVAETYRTLGKRSVDDVFSSLVYLARQYDVKYPIEEGVLTKEYWENYFSEESTMQP